MPTGWVATAGAPGPSRDLWDKAWSLPPARLAFKTPNLPLVFDKPCCSQLCRVLGQGRVSSAGCWVLLSHKGLFLCHGHQQAASFRPRHCPASVLAQLYRLCRWILIKAVQHSLPSIPLPPPPAVDNLRQPCSSPGSSESLTSGQASLPNLFIQFFCGIPSCFSSPGCPLCRPGWP